MSFGYILCVVLLVCSVLALVTNAIIVSGQVPGMHGNRLAFVLLAPLVTAAIGALGIYNERRRKA